MLLVISLFAFIMVFLLTMVACETYAMHNPEDNFSKWWRENIVQTDK